MKKHSTLNITLIALITLFCSNQVLLANETITLSTDKTRESYSLGISIGQQINSSLQHQTVDLD